MRYGDGAKGYIFWFPSQKQVVMSRNFVFEECFILKILVESILETKSEDFHKQLKLQEIQSDYPGSTDPCQGSIDLCQMTQDRVFAMIRLIDQCPFTHDRPIYIIRSTDLHNQIDRSMSDKQYVSSNSRNQCAGSEKCSIAKAKPKKVDVRPPQRYHFEDMVGYALMLSRK